MLLVGCAVGLGRSLTVHVGFGGVVIRLLLCLDLDVSLKRNIRNMALYTSIARVDGEQVACAEILCAEVKV